MSNKLITDSFPKAKKDSLITQKLRQTKARPVDIKGKPSAKADKDVSIDARQDDLKTLREFDLSPEFGPCLGMTRLERWERADRYGLNPPQDVKKILALHPTDSNYTDCLWSKENL